MVGYLEMTVNGRCLTSVVIRMKTKFLGGSSNTLRNAFHTSVVKKSHPSTMITLYRAWEGEKVPSMALILSISALFDASISFTSWLLFRLMVLHSWQFRHGHCSICEEQQFRAAANILAVVVFPVPRGPMKRYTGATFPFMMEVESDLITILCPTTSLKLWGRYFWLNVLCVSCSPAAATGGVDASCGNARAGNFFSTLLKGVLCPFFLAAVPPVDKETAFDWCSLVGFLLLTCLSKMVPEWSLVPWVSSSSASRGRPLTSESNEEIDWWPCTIVAAAAASWLQHMSENNDTSPENSFARSAAFLSTVSGNVHVNPARSMKVLVLYRWIRDQSQWSLQPCWGMSDNASSSSSSSKPGAGATDRAFFRPLLWAFTCKLAACLTSSDVLLLFCDLCSSVFSFLKFCWIGDSDHIRVCILSLSMGLSSPSSLWNKLSHPAILSSSTAWTLSNAEKLPWLLQDKRWWDRGEEGSVYAPPPPPPPPLPFSKMTRLASSSLLAVSPCHLASGWKPVWCRLFIFFGFSWSEPLNFIQYLSNSPENFHSTLGSLALIVSSSSSSSSPAVKSALCSSCTMSSCFKASLGHTFPSSTVAAVGTSPACNSLVKLTPSWELLRSLLLFNPLPPHKLLTPDAEELLNDDELVEGVRSLWRAVTSSMGGWWTSSACGGILTTTTSPILCTWSRSCMYVCMCASMYVHLVSWQCPLLPIRGAPTV